MADDLKPEDFLPSIPVVRLKMGDPMPIFTKELWSSFLFNELSGFQRARTQMEDHWLDAMRYAMQPKLPLTRWQKIKRTVAWWFRERRVSLARWIAGDEWPDED